MAVSVFVYYSRLIVKLVKVLDGILAYMHSGLGLICPGHPPPQVKNKYSGRPSMENVRDVVVITKQFILWAGLCDPKICGLCGCLALTLHSFVLLFAYLYCVTYICIVRWFGV